MKRFSTAWALLGLAFAGCVTPSASLTDLTQKNLQTAQTLAEAQRATLDQFEEFLWQLEQRELEEANNIREKIDRVANAALSDRARVIESRAAMRFEQELRNLYETDYARLVQRDFEGPIRRALEIDRTHLADLARTANEFQEDRLAQEAYRREELMNEMRRTSIAEAIVELSQTRDQQRSDARERFERSMHEALRSFDETAPGAARKANSLSDILTFEKVEEEEPVLETFADHREAIENWRLASDARVDSHLEALDAADRYLRGKRLTFLFVQGAEDLAPLELPEIPDTAELALGDVLAELEARESRLHALELQLEEVLATEIQSAEKNLVDEINRMREALTESLRFSQPR